MTARVTHQSRIKDLLLLVSVPLAVIAIGSAVLYVPRYLANPSYDFIYYNCESYSCSNSYFVSTDGQIEERQEQRGYSFAEPSELYYYDVQNDSTRAISLSEARNHRLEPSSKSPDGYTLSRDDSGGGFLFWGDYESGWYLIDGVKRRKITISPNTYYSGDVKFLGWVEQ